MIKALLSFVAGGILVAAFFIMRQFTADLPPSELASPESTAALARQMDSLKPHLLDLASAEPAEMREILD